MYTESVLKIPGTHHQFTVWIDPEEKSGKNLSIRLGLDAQAAGKDGPFASGQARDQAHHDTFGSVSSAFLRELGKEMERNSAAFPQGGLQRDGESMTWSARADINDVSDGLKQAFDRALLHTEAGKSLIEQSQRFDRDAGLAPVEERASGVAKIRARGEAKPSGEMAADVISLVERHKGDEKGLQAALVGYFDERKTEAPRHARFAVASTSARGA